VCCVTRKIIEQMVASLPEERIRTPSPYGSELWDEEEPYLKICVHGGTKDEVEESFRRYLAPRGDPRIYRTWLNVELLKRLGLLFTGGVESAGGIVEILCVFVIIVLVFALFAFAQFFVFMVVVAVLAILSGGAALKTFRTIYIEIPINLVNLDGLEDFVRREVAHGNFVSTSSKGVELGLGPVAESARRATLAFRWGIYICQAVGFVFAILEILHWVSFGSWWWDPNGLVLLGGLFLIGILVMDAGVIARHRLDSRVSAEMDHSDDIKDNRPELTF